MRSDYALYAVAIICFIISGVSAAAYIATQPLWTVTPVVFGFVFIGLGYTLRPKRAVTTQIAVAPPPPSVVAAPTPKVTEVVEEKKPVETRPEPVVQAEPVVEVKPPSAGLLEVKGIGEKRAEQLRTLGVSTVEDLATASAKDLATKLKISPKITGKWIENAKGIVEKPR
ncbi:MAG: helix-hairpin-helix domain-containing protein [Candidatus Bathyarchaeia archaeon]|jgi:predicted flap endonuclease-1-like 5' DNA nuclease